MNTTLSTWLVTGAAGFIGMHTSLRLLARGDSVIGLDNLNDYYPVDFKKRNLSLLHDYTAFKFERCELANYDDLKNIFAKYDISHVGHLAARAGVRPSIEQPFVYEESNVK